MLYGGACCMLMLSRVRGCVTLLTEFMCMVFNYVLCVLRSLSSIQYYIKKKRNKRYAYNNKLYLGDFPFVILGFSFFFFFF